MRKQRVRIKLTFSADLDPVPGWGDKPEDWITMLQQRIGAENGGPYNMHLTVDEVVHIEDAPWVRHPIPDVQ